MSKDPAFLFYSSDFLTGVSDLTMDERGQYITLLCLQHQKGRLSEKMIAIAVGKASGDVMSKFKKDDEGLYFNERLETEAGKRAEHSRKQRDRAIDGWKKRKSRSNAVGDATANATALPLEDENENEDSGKGDARGKGKFTKPDWKQVANYILGRQEKKDRNEAKYQAEKFLAYNDTVGWLVGRYKKPMKDWKGAVRTWMLNQEKFAQEDNKRNGVSEKLSETPEQKEARLKEMDNFYVWKPTK